MDLARKLFIHFKLRSEFLIVSLSSCKRLKTTAFYSHPCKSLAYIALFEVKRTAAKWTQIRKEDNTYATWPSTEFNLCIKKSSSSTQIKIGFLLLEKGTTRVTTYGICTLRVSLLMINHMTVCPNYGDSTASIPRPSKC